MKIIISSKILYELLMVNIDFTPTIVQVSPRELFLSDRIKTISIPCENLGEGTVAQDNVRWDWLKRDLRGIQEQPVVIEFDKNKLKVILTY